MARSRFYFSTLAVCACFAVAFTACQGFAVVFISGYTNPDNQADWSSSTDLHIGSQDKSGHVNVVGGTADVKNCYLGVGSDSDVSDTYGNLEIHNATFSVSEDFYMGRYMGPGLVKGVGKLEIISGHLYSAGNFNNDNSTIYIDPGYGTDEQAAIQIDGNFNSYGGTIKIDCSTYHRYVSPLNGELIDSYTPISCTGTWNNISSITVTGGRWDDSTHTVRLSEVRYAELGETTTFNPVNTQLITLPDDALTMAFESPTVDAGDMSVAVAETSDENVHVLQTDLMPTQHVAAAYDFDVTNLPEGSAVTLIFQLDNTVNSVDQLSFFHGDADSSGDITWAPFLAPEEPRYDSATRRVTIEGIWDFSSYAVVVNVPEPTTIALLGLGAAAALFKRRKNN